jgi:hypothetical protein
MKRIGGECLVEGGLKNCDLWLVWKKYGDNSYTLRVGGLCSGAKSASSSMLRIIVSLMAAASRKYSPP